VPFTTTLNDGEYLYAGIISYAKILTTHTQISYYTSDASVAYTHQLSRGFLSSIITSYGTSNDPFYCGPPSVASFSYTSINYSNGGSDILSSTCSGSTLFSTRYFGYTNSTTASTLPYISSGGTELAKLYVF
jgi:hypothetical protein